MSLHIALLLFQFDRFKVSVFFLAFKDSSANDNFAKGFGPQALVSEKKIYPIVYYRVIFHFSLRNKCLCFGPRVFNYDIVKKKFLEKIWAFLKIMSNEILINKIQLWFDHISDININFHLKNFQCADYLYLCQFLGKGIFLCWNDFN